MINFSTLQGLTIPEGVVTQITDASGRVLWAVSGGKVILEVEKVTSDVYAGGTTYTGEQFILLDIYPKTNGTVSVTYGGLTKTITDTSGAEEPNAQQVFFGTLGGVSDSVATPASGELTIEGDYYAFGQGAWKTSSKSMSVTPPLPCIMDVIKWGEVNRIPPYAFIRAGLKNVTIGTKVTRIANSAFSECDELVSVTIHKNVVFMGDNPFNLCNNLKNIIVENENNHFVSDGCVLFSKDRTRLICAEALNGHYTIPASVTSIDDYAFGEGITSVTVLTTTPPTLGVAVFGGTLDPYVQSIIVPQGCGDVYKAAEQWSNYADLIVEAS